MTTGSLEDQYRAALKEYLDARLGSREEYIASSRLTAMSMLLPAGVVRDIVNHESSACGADPNVIQDFRTAIWKYLDAEDGSQEEARAMADTETIGSLLPDNLATLVALEEGRAWETKKQSDRIFGS